MQRKRNINFVNIVGSALMAGIVTLLLWRALDPRGFVVFVILLAGAELFVQLRWRLSIVCRTCGFDPILYMKNPDAAAGKVKERLDQRRQDPASLLSRPLNLPSVAPERAEELEKIALAKAEKRRGGLVSKSI